MDILVFKTNIDDPGRYQIAAEQLRLLPGILRINVDMQDCDRVLRIEARGIGPRQVESTLRQGGILCEELPD